MAEASSVAIIVMLIVHRPVLHARRNANTAANIASAIKRAPSLAADAWNHVFGNVHIINALANVERSAIVRYAMSLAAKNFTVDTLALGYVEKFVHRFVAFAIETS